MRQRSVIRWIQVLHSGKPRSDAFERYITAVKQLTLNARRSRMCDDFVHPHLRWLSFQSASTSSYDLPSGNGASDSSGATVSPWSRSVPETVRASLCLKHLFRNANLAVSRPSRRCSPYADFSSANFLRCCTFSLALSPGPDDSL